jgi:hypothetical protein
MIKEKEKILKAPLGEEEKEKKKRMREEEKRKKKEDAEEEEGIICDEKSVSLLTVLKVVDQDSDYIRISIWFVQCCGSEMFNPDPGYEFFHPGYRVKKIPDPGSASKNLIIFSPKIVLKLSEI